MNTTPQPAHAATPATGTGPRIRRAAVATAVVAGTVTVGLGVGGSADAIVAGQETTIAENPWQVALTDEGGDYCGGSLIADRVVLTAAHCVVGTPESDITIRAGVTDLATSEGERRGVKTVAEYADYALTDVGDLAVLVLDAPFELSDTIATIPIATPDELSSATTSRATGWGVTDEETGTGSTVLKSADLPLVSDADCDIGIDAAGEVCAGGLDANTCWGDSGGPLTIDTKRGRALVGVTSWGADCGVTTLGSYAEVPAYAEWINQWIADPDATAPDRIDTDDASGGDDDMVDDELVDDELADDESLGVDGDFEAAFAARLDEAGIDYEWVNTDGERLVQVVGEPDDDTVQQIEEIMDELLGFDQAGGDELDIDDAVDGDSIGDNACDGADVVHTENSPELVG